MKIETNNQHHDFIDFRSYFLLIGRWSIYNEFNFDSI